ncbi:MAG: replication initiation protein [Lachnospiraceae bacterium]|nr:replication initiation protein [Lachnospiraceae bacterium]
MNITENTNIVQSNYLVENRPSLTKDETRLFLTIIGAINKDDSEFNLLQIPVKEFAALWGMETRHAYQQIKDALRGLRSKEFYIEGENPQTGKQRFLTASSVSAAVYEEGEGYATVEVSQLFRPYLLELKEKYTIYVLQNIMNLSGVNTIRNYEILKQYQTLGQRKMMLSEYKRILHIEDKYPRNIDLKRYVIAPAIQEINEKTDIYVTYDFGGRSDKAFVIFTIKSQKLASQLGEASVQSSESTPAINVSSSKETPDNLQEQSFSDNLDNFSFNDSGCTDEDAEERALDARSELCAGFEHPAFAEFSMPQLEVLYELAYQKVSEEDVNWHNRHLKNSYLARQYAVSDYIRQKILYCNAQQNPVDHRYSYIKRAVIEDWK